jgi:hypothetical protein
LEGIVIALVAAGAVAGFWLATRRAVTIAELAIEDGEIRVVRGGLPPAVLGDLRDVVRDPLVRRATLRIVRAVKHAEVRIGGEVSASQAQRVRNIVGSVPLARLARSRRV